MNTQSDDMPTPRAEETFTLTIDFAPAEAVGRLATGGVREVLSITSGHIGGRSLDATVVSGTETRLARCDGVTTVEVSCLLRPEALPPIRLVGTGFLTDAIGTRMNVYFEVAEGSEHDWLATRVFVAERALGGTAFAVNQVV